MRTLAAAVLTVGILASPNQCANPQMVWPSCTPRGNEFLTPGGGGDRAPKGQDLIDTIGRLVGGIL